MSRIILLTALVLVAATATTLAQNCNVGSRSDCGYVGIDQAQCQDRGCCWNPQPNVPWCYYAITTVPIWSVAGIQNTANGFTAQIALTNPGAGSFGPALSKLLLTATYETDSRVHFKITDPNNARYEIPQTVLPYPQAGTVHMPHPGQKGSFNPDAPTYSVNVAQQGALFTLQVVRTSDGVTLFDLANLEYSNQFLQFSTNLPDSGAPFLYGIGEHVMTFQLPTNDHTFTLFNADCPTCYDQNIYGAHPFYMQTLSESGNAHGLFLRNSNGMDVVTSTTQVTFKAIGGILDFYVFIGPSQEEVVQQYHGVIGLPHFPPYWSLGWHQCKYGWKNLAEVQAVVAAYASNAIPLDTIWGDIDYMDNYEDFSWDPNNYPLNQVKQFANDLHNAGQHYVVIVDPGIHNRTGYAPYDQGIQQNIFVKEGDGQTNLIGKVWPGYTAFPDFFNPNTQSYWSDQISGFLSGVPYDGLWIDMNEISNFIDGTEYNVDAPDNNPPYEINNFGGHYALNKQTLPMDAIHYGPLQEYDVHNLFGLTEAMATSAALEAFYQKRSFVLSRSTFSGSGAHTAHWTGDNHANWDDIYRSIPGILNMNLYGIPMVGADICGFLGATTEELCGRWTALGAFYPFSRNHHEPQENQEPYLWASVKAVAQKVLAMRYSLLPTLYTNFYRVNTVGGTVARSLMFNFPKDPNTYSIDTQFMWGSQILITPVLTQGATSVQGYFPPGAVWYNLWNMTRLLPSSDGYQTLPCAIEDAIVLHVAGGSILPQQQPEMTTAATRLNPFYLTVAFDANGLASGQLFWDDGEELQVGSNAILINFQANLNGGSITSTITFNTFTGTLPSLEGITFGGFSFNPTSVSVNGQPLSSSAIQWNQQEELLVLEPISVPLTQAFTVTWSTSAQQIAEY